MSMVEWKTLGDLGIFENIGTDKKTVAGEQLVTLLNYVDIYHNKYIDKSIPSMIVSASDKKRQSCTVEEGDIFVTPSSETIDDIGHSAVVTETIPNAVYSYHIMRYRLFQKNMLLSYYINYSFDTDSVKKQILQKAQGLTRFGLSKDKFSSIIIPIPSLEEQERIVGILDTFTAAIDNLKKQIEERRKQYEFYRDQLLDLEGKPGVEPKTLGEVCDIRGRIGFRGYTRNDQVDEGQGALSLSPGNIVNSKIFYNNSTFITWDKYEESPEIKIFNNDILLCKTGSTVGKVVVIENLPCKATINPQLVVLKNISINKKLLFYLLGTYKVQSTVKALAGVGSVPNISQAKLGGIELLIPPISQQQQIVEKLDAFESSIANLEQQLAMRQKQYEYYRNKLLTFE